MRLRVVTRIGPDVSYVAPYVLASLAAHVLFVVVIVLLPSLRPRRPVLDTPLFVDLVAPAPAASALEPAGTPPPASPPVEEARPSEGVRTETRPLEPRPLPEPSPEPPPKRPPPRAEPKPARTAQPTGPPAEERPETSAAVSGPGGPPGGASITALEGTGDVELGWYKGQITAALYQAWRKPVLDRLSEMREVRVSFDILRDGSVNGLGVAQSSGVPSLDRSALRAVSDALPLPPLPPNWREPRLSAAFVFRLYPE